MNLKKRAAGAIAVAMSVVVMTSVAQAAPADCGITGNNDGLSYKWNCRNRSIYESV